MAERALFHLRKRSNALIRTCHQTRHNSAQTPQQARVHAEQIQYLRAQDQKLLEDTKRQCDRLIEQVQKATSAIAALPSTVQRIPSIAPYHIGGLIGQKIREAPNSAAVLIQKTEHVKEHLTDLQLEPYPEKDQTEAAKWAEEIGRMSTEEKETRLTEMKIHEVAEMARLKVSSEALLRRIKEIEDMSAKSAGAVDEPIRAPNLFRSEGPKAGAGKDEGRDRDKDKQAKAQSTWTKDKEAKVESTRVKEPALSLADRMARLEKYG